MQATVFIATSVDGFIARNNGDIDWLPGESDTEDGEDYGYREFIDSVDVIVMGRNTFTAALSFGAWPYDNKPVVILSSRAVDIPADIANTVECMTATPSEVIQRLMERGHSHVYIDGGKTIQGFLSEGLIQQFIITQVPILIGAGIPLFGPLPRDVRLRHLKTRSFENGLVQSYYAVCETATQ